MFKVTIQNSKGVDFSTKKKKLKKRAVLLYPFKKKKGGVRYPLYLHPPFSVVLILTVDVILMGFGYWLNRFYI